MIVEELELTQVGKVVKAADLADLLVVKNNLLYLSFPWVMRINNYTSSNCLSFCYLLAFRRFHLVVFLLSLQVVCDHLGIHLDRSLVNYGRVFVTELEPVKFLQCWQLLEDVGSIV